MKFRRLRGEAGPLAGMSLQNWDRVIAVTLLGVLRCIEEERAVMDSGGVRRLRSAAAVPPARFGATLCRGERKYDSSC